MRRALNGPVAGVLCPSTFRPRHQTTPFALSMHVLRSPTPSSLYLPARSMLWSSLLSPQHVARPLALRLQLCCQPRARAPVPKGPSADPGSGCLPQHTNFRLLDRIPHEVSSPAAMAVKTPLGG